MIETVRARLTLWYVSVLGAVLVVVTVTIYVMLARTLYSRIDDDLYRVVTISINSLANDLAEGQDAEDAARSTAAELASSEQLLAIFDSSGRLLAEAERPDDLDIELPAEEIPDDEPLVYTVIEKDDLDDRHRLAVRRVSLDDGRRDYIVLVGTSLEPVDEELESLRGILYWVVPMGLVIAGIGGWFLARRSFEPVVTMAERARRIGVENIEARLPVQNPRDELGRLARAADTGGDREDCGWRCIAGGSNRRGVSRVACPDRAGDRPVIAHRGRHVHAGPCRCRQLSSAPRASVSRRAGRRIGARQPRARCGEAREHRLFVCCGCRTHRRRRLAQTPRRQRSR
jgi:HAMP domain-containing protein